MNSVPTTGQKRMRVRGKKRTRKRTKEVKSGQQENDKCQICFFEVLKKDHKRHYASELHKNLSELKRQCLFEARFAPTLKEQIEKIDKKKAEWELKNGKLNKDGKTPDKKAPSGGSLKKEAPGEETPDKGASNMEEPDMGASNMEEPGKGASNMEEPVKGASNMEEPVKGDSNMEEPGKGISNMKEPCKGDSNMKEPGKGDSNMEEPSKGASNMKEPGKGASNMEEPGSGAPNKKAADMGKTTKMSSNKEIHGKQLFETEKVKHSLEIFFKQLAYIGLEYILEYLPNEEGKRSYVCKLCKDVYGRKGIYYHTQSVKHRIMYLAKHHKEMGINMNYKVDTQNKYRHLVACTQNIEKKSGRKNPKIMNKVYVEKTNPEELQGKEKNAKALPMEGFSRDPAFHRDPRSYFSRLGFAETMRMERDSFRVHFLRCDPDNPFIGSEGCRRGVGYINEEEARLRRTFSDGRYSMSQEYLMMRRLGSDGHYPMSPEDLVMRRHSSDGSYPISREDAIICSRSRDGQYSMSQADVMMCRPFIDGLYTGSEEDAMFKLNHALLKAKAVKGQEGAGLQSGFSHGRSRMSLEGAALCQSTTDPRTQHQEASTMHRSAIVSHQIPRERGAIKRPAHADDHASFVSRSIEPENIADVDLAAPSNISQKLAAIRRDGMTASYTKGFQGKTFKELKAAHEAVKRKLAKSGESFSESDRKIDPDDSCLDEFWCNHEVYDFLANFEVESKEDVEYVLKVIDRFANALIAHKKRTKESKMRILEEKKKLEEDKMAFLNTSGVSKALNSKTEQGKFPPEATPHKSQAHSDVSSSTKPLSSGASSMNPAPAPQPFDSYHPTGPAVDSRQPKKPRFSQDKESQPSPAASIRPQGIVSSMQLIQYQQSLDPRVNRRVSFKEPAPSFSESRPTLEEEQRHNVNQPKPSINESSSSVNKCSQPLDQSRSSLTGSRPPKYDSGPPVTESRPPCKEQRSPLEQSRPPWNETKPYMSEPRPGMHDSKQFESMPLHGEIRSSLNDPRLSLSKSKPEARQPHSESRLPQPGQLYIESRLPQPGQPYIESRLPQPGQPYIESRQHYSESRQPDARQPYSESRPPQPEQPYSESRQHYSESKLSQPGRPYSESRPLEPRQPYNELRLLEPRQTYSQSRPPEPWQPYSDPRSQMSDKFTGADIAYNQNNHSHNPCYLGTRFGNSGSTGGPRPSYGHEVRRFEGYMNNSSSGQHYSESSYISSSYPMSKQRPSFHLSTNRPPGTQSHQPPGSMGPPYNMAQGQWSNQMASRADTYPMGGYGDGTIMNRFPTGYLASPSSIKFSRIL
ncbi:uncharacterized protein [Pyxicephalus adspersus]|uniref:uncharacterized protein n=1 Tax=Pyxicephalus adspersus TaxID=30357 RepID=UPI003B59496A